MPGFLWILVGMVLVLVLSGLLVWLDIVDIPYALRVRLPDPIGEIVDALENARNPGGVAAANPPTSTSQNNTALIFANGPCFLPSVSLPSFF